MKTSFNLILLLSLLSFGLFSCEKESSTIKSNETSNLFIGFDNRVGTENLFLDSMMYINALGQEYSITKLNYLISNIEIIKEDNSIFTVPKDSCYFIVRESDPYSRKIKISNVPFGTYKAIRFTIGVDSAKSVSPVGERMGNLNPAGNAADMYWAWNSGYIFMKMEGESLAIPSDPITGSRDPLSLHIGGYGGYGNTPTINNLKTVTLSFPSDKAIVPASIAGDLPFVHIYADPSKIINGTTNLDFSQKYSIAFTPYSVNLANNYVEMFVVEHVHNN